METDKLDYKIMPPLPNEAEILGKLRAEGWYEQYGNLPGINPEWIAKQVERITSKENTKQRELSIKNSQNDNSVNFWRVARLTKNHAIIGFIDARKLDDGTQEIHSIHVMKGYRNQGIGQTLMDEAHKWFDHSKPIIIDVANGNFKAQRFYTREPNNYSPTGYAYHFEQLQMIRLERK